MSVHESWFDDIPGEFARLVDKGFAHTTQYYKNGSFALVPAFVEGDGDGLTRKQLQTARRQSSDRYTCEVFFSRVKLEFGMVNTRIGFNRIHALPTAWAVGHMTANFMSLLREPAEHSRRHLHYMTARDRPSHSPSTTPLPPSPSTTPLPPSPSTGIAPVDLDAANVKAMDIMTSTVPRQVSSRGRATVPAFKCSYGHACGVSFLDALTSDLNACEGLNCDAMVHRECSAGGRGRLCCPQHVRM